MFSFCSGNPDRVVETIGEALDAGWVLTARCAFGKHEGLKTVRECTWRHDLDMVTLVATRGRDFPLARIAERLRCPRCGSRRIAVMFVPARRPPDAMHMRSGHRW